MVRKKRAGRKKGLAGFITIVGEDTGEQQRVEVAKILKKEAKSMNEPISNLASGKILKPFFRRIELRSIPKRRKRGKSFTEENLFGISGLGIKKRGAAISQLTLFGEETKPKVFFSTSILQPLIKDKEKIKSPLRIKYAKERAEIITDMIKESLTDILGS